MNKNPTPSALLCTVQKKFELFLSDALPLLDLWKFFLLAQITVLTRVCSFSRYIGVQEDEQRSQT